MNSFTFSSKFIKTFFICTALLILLYFFYVYFGKALYCQIYEYPIWKTKFTTLSSENSKSPISIILGDSTAVVGLNPQQIDKYMYNYALGGASPITSYFQVKQLGKTQQIRQAFIVYTPFHFEWADTFWNRGLMFKLYSFSNYKELFYDVLNTNSFPQNENKMNFIKDYFGYLFGHPHFYKFAIKKLGDLNIKNKLKTYENIVKTAKIKRGWIDSGENSSFVEGVSAAANKQNFVIKPIINLYFKKLIHELTKKNVKVTIVNPPVDPFSYKKIKNNYKKEFNQFFLNLKKEFPDLQINSNFVKYEKEFFSDPVHLNRLGSERFSLYLKEMYF